MLTIYPAVGYDSFVSEVDADAVIASYTVDSAQWLALSQGDKEIYLRIATSTIKAGIDLATYPLPDPAPPCLADATALTAVHNLVNGLSASAAAKSAGEVKKQKVGSLEVEYFESGNVSRSTNWIPALARNCLTALHYTFVSGGGFKQTLLGRS